MLWYSKNSFLSLNSILINTKPKVKMNNKNAGNNFFPASCISTVKNRKTIIVLKDKQMIEVFQLKLRKIIAK